VQAAVAAVQKRIEARDGPNLGITRIDVSGKMEYALQKLWEAQDNVGLAQAGIGAGGAWGVLCYPRAEGQPDYAVAWAGPVTGKGLAAVIDSPVRQQIARHILEGDAAVWVLLESGDKKADDALAQRLEAVSEQLVAALTASPAPPAPPEPAAAGDAGADAVPPAPGATNDAGADAVPPAPGADMGAEAVLPEPLDFSLVRLSRKDPAEKVFIQMLLPPQAGLSAVTGPMVFPVFGRGRVLGALHGERLAPAALYEVGDFVCGECANEVKVQYPGFDALIATDWTALPDMHPPPALPRSGMAPRRAAATQPAAAGAATGASVSRAHVTVPVARLDDAPFLGGPLILTLLATAVVATLVAIGVALGVSLRSRQAWK
jgi:hypothetical protein